MKQELSILIPTYNDDCTPVVTALLAQAQAIPQLSYEIIIGDDGSTNESVITRNNALSRLPHCRVITTANRGRAAIRNTLAKAATYPWLLFLDAAHKRIHRDTFLTTYLSTPDTQLVVYGGYELLPPDGALRQANLRYKYERSCTFNRDARRRQKSPASTLNSSNFLAHSDVFRLVQFNEQLTTYGYEDVLLGREMQHKGILIHHIDNPTLLCVYDDNATYLRKTIEAVHTLKQLAAELHDSSRLITLATVIRRLHLRPLVTTIHHHCHHRWTANLTSSHPSLIIFHLLRLSILLE